MQREDRDEKARVGKGVVVRGTSCEQMEAMVYRIGLRVVCIDESEDGGRLDRFAGLEDIILEYLRVDELLVDGVCYVVLRKGL